MIDIIIPAYNNHKTIINTLHSISNQYNVGNIKVTIVNDGGKDYKDIINFFQHFLTIQEIGYEDNRGPGYARNYGLKNTREEFIMFLDADDVLCGYGSTYLLSRCLIDNPTAQYIISDFQHTVSGFNMGVENNLLVSFGHMYRRKFLENNDIKFLSTMFFEDMGFNTLCEIYAQNNVIQVAATTYEWLSSETSYSQNLGEFYDRVLSVPGYIYNSIQIFKHLKQHNIDLSTIEEKILTTALHIYFYYNTLLVRKNDIPQIIITLTEELSKQFYQTYYKYININNIKYFYNELYNSYLINNNAIDFKLYINLEDFIEMTLNSDIDKTLVWSEEEKKLIQLGREILQ